MSLPPDIIDAILRLESQTLVRQVEWFPEIGSTNDYALSLADQSDIELPRLIWADRQTAGRGRSGHAWWSAAGALTFSLLVDPQRWGLRPEQWPKVSLITGIAIAEALSRHVPGQSVRVKWPNDVYLNDRKVCGILTEPTPQRNPAWLVIGVGINVNNSFTTAPPELRQTATALCDEGARDCQGVDVLLSVLSQWEQQIQQLAATPDSLQTTWQNWCWLREHRVRITTAADVTEGHCQGIDDAGALLIETARGLTRHYAGTVRRLD
ncbi:biotin--[acetyl-CoA-carboxylase] ligase [bacterium]|nr:biotin--[acetyl-CoA-carboxylase] ligase [bacterium]